MENAEITELDRIMIPRGADEYYERVQGIIRPFLDAVMSGARAFDECSTRLENEVLCKPNTESCDEVAGVETPWQKRDCGYSDNRSCNWHLSK